MYNITEYSRKQAIKLGVTIKPSGRRNKKIDVFKNGKYLASIGDIRYLDYPNYIKTKGQEYADKRRKLYKIRHKYNTGTAGYYASNILW
jgi:hypothetical protein